MYQTINNTCITNSKHQTVVQLCWFCCPRDVVTRSALGTLSLIAELHLPKRYRLKEIERRHVRFEHKPTNFYYQIIFESKLYENLDAYLSKAYLCYYTPLYLIKFEKRAIEKSRIGRMNLTAERKKLFNINENRVIYRDIWSQPYFYQSSTIHRSIFEFRYYISSTKNASARRFVLYLQNNYFV